MTKSKWQCKCGEIFEGTLNGAWDAKLHTEETKHIVESSKVWN